MSTRYVSDPDLIPGGWPIDRPTEPSAQGRDLQELLETARRLIERAGNDPFLRAAIRTLGEELIAAADEPPPVEKAAPGMKEDIGVEISRIRNEPDAVETNGSGPSRPGQPFLPPEPSRPPARREPLRELTLGRRVVSPPPPPVNPVSHAVAEKEELDQLVRRCRAKAAAIRWHAESHRRVWEGVDAPMDEIAVAPELHAWAEQLVNCFYWLDEEDAPEGTDLSLLDNVGGCYEAIAEALELSASARNRRGLIGRTLPLMAEAQSMLRRALQILHAPEDPDQLDVYQRVRDAAARNRMFVKRYMRTDDPADPTNWSNLVDRIEALNASDDQTRQQKERIEGIREPLQHIRAGRAGDDDWQAVVNTVEELIGEGVPPSNREIRDLLLPVIDDLPDRDDLPPGFHLVLREIDRFLSTRATPTRVAANYVPPAEVKEAARLIEGRSVVLIGGARRPEAQATLRQALHLKDLIWIETREHQSIESFEAVIARPEVALVLLAIRWSSHSFGDVRQFCIRHGKPLVRLPGGYGLHQVAAQIISQCSELLGGR
ncbi:MAG: hypothetical protein ACYC61_16025 [Isosphaeraceae bacterium]